MDEERISALAARADVVLDASDNFATRHAVNRACVAATQAARLRRGGAFRRSGRCFDLRGVRVPCYACLFPEDGENEDMPCAVMGVFAPLTGIIGTIQAAEALKLMTGHR